MKKQILIALLALATASSLSVVNAASAQESTGTSQTPQGAPTSNGAASSNQQQPTVNNVGGTTGYQSQTGSGRAIHDADRSEACVGPVSFCNIYFGN
jgi:hypothetical protein